MRYILDKFIDSYFLIILASLLLGVIFSGQTVFLAQYSTLFLGTIFFLSALKIDLKEVVKYFDDKKMIVVANIFMLIVLPIAVYYLTSAIFPSLAMAFLILAAMPTGMTAPLLAEVVGGKQSLALIFTISTSLLAPITVPAVIKLVGGADVAVSFFDMFISLAKVIFIPFILANIAKYFWDDTVEKISYTFKSISVIFLSLLIIGIVAKQADAIIDGLFGGESLLYLVLLFIFFGILHILGYFAVFWRKKPDRITITVCLTYMNFTLAIYLVDKFFEDPYIVVPVVLSVLPWSILLIPFRYLSTKFL